MAVEGDMLLKTRTECMEGFGGRGSIVVDREGVGYEVGMLGEEGDI